MPGAPSAVTEMRQSVVALFVAPDAAVVIVLTGLLLLRDVDGRWIAGILAMLLAVFIAVYVTRLRKAKPIPPESLKKKLSPFVVAVGAMAVGALLCAIGIAIAFKSATDLHAQLSIVIFGCWPCPSGSWGRSRSSASPKKRAIEQSMAAKAAHPKRCRLGKPRFSGATRHLLALLVAQCRHPGEGRDPRQAPGRSDRFGSRKLFAAPCVPRPAQMLHVVVGPGLRRDDERGEASTECALRQRGPSRHSWCASLAARSAQWPSFRYIVRDVSASVAFYQDPPRLHAGPAVRTGDGDHEKG